MRKSNQQIFEEVSGEAYFKSNHDASKKIKDIICFPDILGYDPETKGFVVLHKNHSPSAILDEMPACQLLKNFGMGVFLLDETIGIFVPDALIETRYFEIKRLHRAKNINGAVHSHFRNTYKKAPNLVLHIDQVVNSNSLRTAIILATKLHSDIRSVWVIYSEGLWRLDRKIILRGTFQFPTK
ncbi:MAG: hypothetical protein ABMA02_19680 [Saprospiraceae bacterium]